MPKKLMSLSEEVVEKLDQEENYSALVDALLARHYGVELPNSDPHHHLRHAILQSLDEAEFAEPAAEAEWTPMARPMVEGGKPVDGIVQPDKELIQKPNVSINLNGRPADQLDDGRIVNICPTCGRDISLTGICLECL
jgi:hypothetical protein